MIRRKLDRLCRYVARPAIAHARLRRDGDGLVVYELKHALRDSATREGFRFIGVFPEVGRKFDAWHDVAWLYRPLSLSEASTS